MESTPNGICYANEDDDGEVPGYLRLLQQREFAAALPLLEKAIEEGDHNAMAAMGSMLALGYGVRANAGQAVAWLHRAAKAGNVTGQALFGLSLATGFGIAKDEEAGAHWLYMAASHGSRQAMDVLTLLVGRSQSLVGRYFSMDDLFRLWEHYSGHTGSQQ